MLIHKTILSATVNDHIFDSKRGKVGTVKKCGQSGNYSILYVDFGHGLRRINPMDDLQIEGRYELVN